MIIFVKNPFEQKVAETLLKYNKNVGTGAIIEIRQYFDELDSDMNPPVQGVVAH